MSGAVDGRGNDRGGACKRTPGTIGASLASVMVCLRLMSASARVTVAKDLAPPAVQTNRKQRARKGGSLCLCSVLGTVAYGWTVPECGNWRLCPMGCDGVDANLRAGGVRSEFVNYPSSGAWEKVVKLRSSCAKGQNGSHLLS